MNNELNFTPNFEGLVLGCIDASKQASSFRPIQEKGKGTQANRAQLNAHDLILPVLQLQYDREWHIELVNVQYRILTLAYSQVGGVALSFTSFLWHYAEYNCNRMVQSLFMLYSIHLPISLELAPLFNSITFLFLDYVALECCARLPGTLGKKERISSNAIVNSASTSACTASSCASAGFSGIARGPLTVQVRSRHRLSSLPAFALQ